ncbi:MAG: helix-turn-helix domain-containing protein, partial [bacterium]|nr:helix-turn-helix domain-containing protein [bacterium]
MDENIILLLQDLGFNHNETKVFLSLLKLGSAPAAKIAKDADLHRANTYDALNKLLARGVVAYILKENTKCYQI